MKTTFLTLLTGFVAASFSAAAAGQNSPPASANSTTGTSAGSPSSATSSAAGTGHGAPKATAHTGVATFKASADPLWIATPPPPPLSETRPPSPSANHNWVPGHHKPVNGKWTWVAGQWSVRPTPQSVWIEGRYDAESKRWIQGYWQPDGTAQKDADGKNDNGYTK